VWREEGWAGGPHERTLRTPRTVWVVRHGDGLYVRSVNGRTSAWFQSTSVPAAGATHLADVAADFRDPPSGLAPAYARADVSGPQ
jgi:hypothetical protein